MDADNEKRSFDNSDQNIALIATLTPFLTFQGLGKKVAMC